MKNRHLFWTRRALQTALLSAMVVSTSAWAQNTIKIGMITDRVGPAKPYAEPVAAGATYAVKEINARGGILGRQVELLVEDDQGRADISATAARKLVDAGVAFILSVSLTPATQQAQTVTLESKTPHITPSNGGDTLTTQVNNPNFWQTGPLASTQIATLLAYARNKNYKRVTILTDNSAISRATAVAFKTELEKNNIQVASEEMVPAGATSAEAQMQKVRQVNPDAIFLASILTSENLLILRAYRQSGMKTPILANYNLAVPIYMTIAKGLLNGIVFVDAWDPAKPNVQKFLADYKKDTGTEGQSQQGYGYDGVMMAADAIRRAGSTDKQKVRVAMQATRGYQGVLGSDKAVYGFADGRRTGFDPEGIVVRVYEGDQQGKVVHAGTK